jgi:hypothetical protein
MKILLSITALFVAAISALLLSRLILLRRAAVRLHLLRFRRIGFLYEQIRKNQKLTKEDLLGFAENPLTRETAFLFLRDNDITEMFPQQYYSIEKAAESSLASWLEFPTELNRSPDEIEHIGEVTVVNAKDMDYTQYHIFRFRVNEPHFAAKDGWMLGVVGPYAPYSKPYDKPKTIFSRFAKASSGVSPQQEAEWVHRHILMKR